MAVVESGQNFEIGTLRRRAGFFNTSIDCLSMDETVALIEAHLEARLPVRHTEINVAKLVMMQSHEPLRRAVNAFDLISADGQGIVWGANLLGVKVPERVTGIDLFFRLLDSAQAKGYRPYFLGASDSVLTKLLDKVKSRFPELQIAGASSGYFSKHEELEIARGIRASGADMLFVGISCPVREFFMQDHAETMNVPFIMGVGGAFDVLAGKIKRAPLWMQKSGLEWFHRMMAEPGRMWKRYMVTNSIFMGMIMKAMVKNVIRKKR